MPDSSPKNGETATGVVAVSKGKETENIYWPVGVAAMIEVCLERAQQSIHQEKRCNSSRLEH
jgi:hypothetical protein